MTMTFTVTVGLRETGSVEATSQTLKHTILATYWTYLMFVTLVTFSYNAFLDREIKSVDKKN